MSNWIAITDRLPELGVDVLVCKEGEGYIDMARLESITTTQTKESTHVRYEWLSSSDLEDTYFQVTHWQPLPKPV